jgi:PAS domain S-box-containing protein
MTKRREQLNSNKQTDVAKGATPKDGRLTIGFVVDDIVMVGGRNALRGVADAARERDVNLLCFHQRVFQGSEGYPIEMGPASWDTLAEVLDGLVIYQSWPNEEAFAAFRSRFPSLPMANALRVYAGCPALAPDSYQGTKELTRHLIEAHGYRRIAFVAGPEGNWVVEERYRGYVDALAEHGIPLDPNLVTPHLDWAEAERIAIRLLLDERGLLPGSDFEAVVTSNDSIALSMLVEFQSRGVRVPDDVAVVGFDDDSRAVCSMPPLTTIRMPWYETGRQAVDLVLAQIAGEGVPEQTPVLPKMMVRRSCGCQALAVTQAATEPVPLASKEVGLGDVFETQRAQILSDMVRSIGQDDAAGIIAGWVEQVLSGFDAEIEGGTPGVFLAVLEDVLDQVMEAGGDAAAGPGQRVAAWQGAVSALWRWTLPYLDEDKGTHAEGLLQQARVMIAVMMELAQARQALQTEQQAAALRDVSQALITTFDVDGLVDALAGGLLQLGIPGAYLSLYENPAKPVEWSRLVLAYGEEGRVDLGADGLRFPSRQLMPEGMWPHGRRYSFMVSSLFLRESQLGFILYEMGVREGTIYDTLRMQISSALQGALLVQRVQERSAELARQQYILDTFMENVPDSIYFKDRESRFTRINKALARHIEVDDPAEAVGKSDYDFFPEEQARPKYEQEQEIIHTGQPILDLEEPDGGHWALTTKMPLRDESGEIIGTFGISRDITALKEAQAALEQAYAKVEQQVAERTAELEREVEERERAQAESVRLQQEVIEAQQRAIQELSTPIIPVLEGVIVMPLIGSIDTMRARDVTRNLLAGIREHNARVVILDITGVPIVDSGVAAYLNKTVQAARLKGARTIITGISEAVAETVVDLGIDWSGIETLRDLRTGLQSVLAGVEVRSR